MSGRNRKYSSSEDDCMRCFSNVPDGEHTKDNIAKKEKPEKQEKSSYFSWSKTESKKANTSTVDSQSKTASK